LRALSLNIPVPFSFARADWHCFWSALLGSAGEFLHQIVQKKGFLPCEIAVIQCHLAARRHPVAALYSGLYPHKRS
jgi:hypothetical protein